MPASYGDFPPKPFLSGRSTRLLPWNLAAKERTSPGLFQTPKVFTNTDDGFIECAPVRSYALRFHSLSRVERPLRMGWRWEIAGYSFVWKSAPGLKPPKVFTITDDGFIECAPVRSYALRFHSLSRVERPLRKGESATEVR